MDGQRGHLMAGVMVLLAIMLIFSTIIFQYWEDVLRRDNEAEMMFRAQEIARAVARYRKDHAAPPVKLEQLMDPGPKGQYYLRRLYTDPLVRDGKWGLLYAGPGGEVIDPNALHIGENAGFVPGGVDRERVKQAIIDAAGGIDPEQAAQTPQGQMALESEVAGGRQFPGLTIAGVKTLSTDDPFRVYKGAVNYSDWHFTFFDLVKPQVPGQDKRGRRNDRGGGRRGGANRPQRMGTGRDGR
jgi:type II secretory pathway pseudopilin PulG